MRLLVLVLTCVPWTMAQAAQRPGGSARGAEQATRLSVKETSLGRVPNNVVKEQGALVVSPDATRVAYIIKEGGKQRVVVDGVAQQAFDRIIFPMTFSPDGKRLGYAAVVGSGDNVKVVFVIDGQSSAPFDELRVSHTRQAVFFSPDSRHVAFVGVDFSQSRDRSTVVVDGVAGKLHEGGLTKAGLVWSPDSRRWVVCLLKKNGKSVVVADDMPGPEYDSVMTRAHGTVDFNTDEILRAGGHLGTFAFSPDGERLAYAAKRGTTDVIVVDGKEVAVHEGLRQAGPQTEFELGGANGPQLTNEGRLLYFMTDVNRRVACVVVDGKHQKEYRALDSGGGLSPDGKRYAYFAKPSAQERVVVLDGKEGKYSHAGDSRPDDLTFSPDSSRLAARVHRDRKQLFLLDGQEGRAYDALFGFVFSPDSKRYAYAALDRKSGRAVLVIDGKESKPFSNFHETGPSFSPDSQHVGIFAKEGRQWRLLIDGLESRQRYDLALCRLVFTGPTMVRTVAARGNDLYRVEVELDTKTAAGTPSERPGGSPAKPPTPPAAPRKLALREVAALPAFIQNDSSHLTITPDSQRAMLYAKGTAIIWDLTTRKEIYRTPAHTSSALLSRDGKTIFVGAGRSYDELYAYDLATKSQRKASLVNRWNFRLAFSPDGKTLAVALKSPGAEGKILVLFDTADFTEKAAVTGFDARVDDVAFTPDGQHLLAVLYDRESRRLVKLDPATLTERGVLGPKLDKSHYEAWLLVSPDGRLAAVHHQKDTPIAVSDVATGKTRVILPVRTTNNFHSGFAANNTMLIHGTGSDLTFWDLSTGRAVRKLNLADTLGYVIFRGVAISADGRWFAAGTPKGEIVVWDIATMRIAARQKAHLGEIYSLGFTPDGRTLLSVGEEQKLKMWALGGE